MKQLSILLLTVWIVGWGAPLEAADPAPLSLDDCLRLGLETSIPLANARRDIAIAEAGITQTRAQALPQVELNSSYTRLDEVSTFDTGTESIPMGKRDNYNVNTELTQLLYNGGQINAALRASRHYRNFSAWQKATVEANLRLQISLEFHNLLFAESAVTVAEENVVQLRSLLNQAEARYRMQVAAEYEVLFARVRVANATPPLIATSNRVQLARIALANLVCPDSPDLQIVGDLRAPDEQRTLAEFLALGAARRPELQQMRFQVLLQEEDLRAERGTLYPEIKAFADYIGNNPPQLSTASSEWDWHWSAGVRASWPLFEGGLRRGRILEKSLELDKTRDTLEDFKRAVALEIRQAYLDLGQARETIAAAQETQALADRTLAIAANRYGEGLTTALEVSESNLARSQARLTLLNAHREACNALARLRHAAGLTITPPEES